MHLSSPLLSFHPTCHLQPSSNWSIQSILVHWSMLGVSVIAPILFSAEPLKNKYHTNAMCCQSRSSKNEPISQKTRCVQSKNDAHRITLFRVRL